MGTTFFSIQIGGYNISFLLFSLEIINVANFCRISFFSVLNTFLKNSSGFLVLLGSNLSLKSAYKGHSAMKCISVSTLSLQCLQKRSCAEIGVGLACLPLSFPDRVYLYGFLLWLS